MKNIRLHYANLDLEGDIPCYELSKGIELNGFILAEAKEDDCVYLVSIRGEIYVTDNILLIINFIEKFQFEDLSQNPRNLPKEIFEDFNSLIAQINDGELTDIFIQEYPSFEDAYAVALDMKEEHPLCYNQPQTKIKPMAKQIKVEASIATEGRFRDGSGKYCFTIYDRKSNTTIEKNKFPYTRRATAKRGAERWCRKNGYIVALWVK